MRLPKSLILTLSFLLVVPVAPAKPAADWSRVERLSFDAPLTVEMADGELVDGRFYSASPDELRLKFRDPSRNGLTVQRGLPKASIRRVVQIRGRDSDPRRTLAKSQLIGAVGGAAVGAATAGKAWPVGLLLGGLGGAAVGAIVGGAVELAHTAHAAHSTVVYQSDAAASEPKR